MLFGQAQIPKVEWTVMVWERLSIPKHRFILWLVMLEKIRTTEDLGRIGLVTDESCLFCNGGQEVIQHLFFKCTYNLRCIEEINGWLGWKCQAIRMDKLFKWIRKTKLEDLKKIILYVVLSALVYHIWKVRVTAHKWKLKDEMNCNE